MLNHVTLMGRLVRDPERRSTQNGASITNFTLAVERDYKAGGEKETDFIDCIAWRNTADFIANYFSKGRVACVVGKLQIRDWTDKDGNKRRSAEVIVNEAHFGDSRPAADAPAVDKNAILNSPSPFSELDDDGELPF